MLVLALFASSALAARPTWQWDYSKPVNYYLHTEYRFPETLYVVARQNLDERVGSLKITGETTCLPAKLGKSTELTCTFSYLNFSAAPTGSSKQADVDKVMADWNDYLKTVKVDFVLSPEGKLRDFDIGGLERKTLRDGELIEWFRIYLMRLFSPIDLPLTKDDKDWVRGWSDNSLGMMLQLPFASGTAGAGTLTSRFVEERFGLYQVFTEGRATVGAGAAVDSSANGGLVDIRAAGEAWIDPAGILLFRGYQTDAERLASSSTGGAGHYVQQDSMLQRVDAFAADHSRPISVLGQRAPQRADPVPAPAAGIVTVEYASLGMDPLFLKGFPQVAQGYDLPVSTVRALVVVNTDGRAEKVTVYQGYELLVEHVERGLQQAKFPVKDHFYAVDVAVEVRP